MSPRFVIVSAPLVFVSRLAGFGSPPFVFASRLTISESPLLVLISGLFVFFSRLSVIESPERSFVKGPTVIGSRPAGIVRGLTVIGSRLSGFARGLLFLEGGPARFFCRLAEILSPPSMFVRGLEFIIRGLLFSVSPLSIIVGGLSFIDSALSEVICPLRIKFCALLFSVSGLHEPAGRLTITIGGLSKIVSALTVFVEALPMHGRPPVFTAGQGGIAREGRTRLGWIQKEVKPMQLEPWRPSILILFFLVAGTACAKPARHEVRAGQLLFVNRVWTVAESEIVAKGTLYVFLSEGTLVIASPHGKPMLGSWRYERDQLIMVEESITYPTDILHLDKKEFRIRSHNPGTPVEIRFVRGDA